MALRPDEDSAIAGSAHFGILRSARRKRARTWTAWTARSAAAARRKSASASLLRDGFAICRQLRAHQHHAVAALNERAAFLGQVVHLREQSLAFFHPSRILEVAAHVLIGVNGDGRHVATRREFKTMLRRPSR